MVDSQSFPIENFISIVAIIGVAMIYGAMLAQKTSAPEALGCVGERKTADKLHALVKRNSEYNLFNNVILGFPGGTTQVDHILISRFGIFVVETKNMKGWIFGGERQKMWTQSLIGGRYMRFFWNEKYQFKNPLHQNYKHVLAVQAFLGLPLKSIFNVVVFVGNSRFMTVLPSNVLVLQELLPYIKSHRNKIIEEDKVREFSLKLSAHIATMAHLRFDEAYHVSNIERQREAKNRSDCHL